jgi:hypothetical protein
MTHSNSGSFTHPCRACGKPVTLEVDGRWYPVRPSNAVALHFDCPIPDIDAPAQPLRIEAVPNPTFPWSRKHGS